MKKTRKLQAGRFAYVTAIGSAFRSCLGLILSSTLASSALADVVVGHIAPLTGPISMEAKEYNAGIRLAIKAANASGGIGGQKLVLRTLDDEFNPEKTLNLMRQLAASEAVAMLLPIGYPAIARMLEEQLPEKLRLPVIGVIPGADALRATTNPYVFHIRAGDQAQYQKLVEHAITMGMKRIAVAYVDIPFGATWLAAVESTIKQQGRELVARVAFPMSGKVDYSAVVEQLAKTAPDIVYLLSPPQAAGEFLKVYRDKGMTAVLATPSYGNADFLCSIATEEKARGVILAQVVPNVAKVSIPLVRKFHEDLNSLGERGMQATAIQFEAYITTRVFLEGLRRSGSQPTREKLVQSLNGFKSVDIGGYVLDMSSQKHTASDYVDISIIGRGCRLMY